MDGTILLWDLQGVSLRTWKLEGGARVHDLAVSTIDGPGTAPWVVAICSEKRIRLLSVEGAEEHSLSESDAISSMSLGRGAETHMLLLNIGRCSSCPEIHLWDLRWDRVCLPKLLLRKPLHIKTSRRRLVVYKWQIVVRRSRQLVKTFRGQNQERFVIRSALGGIDQSFVISGSEDSQVYIWHRQTARLLGRLEGHSRTVNAVCWSPIDPCAALPPALLPSACPNVCGVVDVPQAFVRVGIG